MASVARANPEQTPIWPIHWVIGILSLMNLFKFEHNTGTSHICGTIIDFFYLPNVGKYQLNINAMFLSST